MCKGRASFLAEGAVLTYLAVLLVDCWWGSGLLELFGISLQAFRIAGGLILLPLG